jgi:hypothetical protein
LHLRPGMISFCQFVLCFGVLPMFAAC